MIPVHSCFEFIGGDVPVIVEMESCAGRNVCRKCETDGSMVVSSVFPISACSKVRLVMWAVLAEENRRPPPNMTDASGL